MRCLPPSFSLQNSFKVCFSEFAVKDKDAEWEQSPQPGEDGLYLLQQSTKWTYTYSVNICIIKSYLLSMNERQLCAWLFSWGICTSGGFSSESKSHTKSKYWSQGPPSTYVELYTLTNILYLGTGWVDCILICIFFDGLECVSHSFAYVAYFVFCIFERCLDSNPGALPT